MKKYSNFDANFHYYDDIDAVYKSNRGIDFSGKNAKDFMITPLHKAALFSPTATRELLKVGADPNAGTEKMGYTPLHLLSLAKEPTFTSRSIIDSAQIIANHDTTDRFKRAPFIIDGKKEHFSAPALALNENRKKLYEAIASDNYGRQIPPPPAQASLDPASALANAVYYNKPDVVDTAKISKHRCQCFVKSRPRNFIA